MKKLVIISLFILSICSCGKMPVNGKLDGMWQLMKIETRGSEYDMKESRLYYNVQLELLGLQSAGYVGILGRFIQTNDSLFVYDFRSSKDNAIPADYGQLATFGIYNQQERFGIETLTHDKMVLRSATATLYFRKF